MSKLKSTLSRVGSNLLFVFSIPIRLLGGSLFLILLALYLFLKKPARDNLCPALSDGFDKAYDVLDHSKRACGCVCDILKL